MGQIMENEHIERPAFESKWPLRILAFFTNVGWVLLWLLLVVELVLVLGTAAGGLIDLQTFAGLLLEEGVNEEIMFDLAQGVFGPFYAMSAFVAATIGVSLFILHQFRQVFRNMKRGEIFSLANAKRFRIVAYVSIAIALIGFSFDDLFSALILLLFAEIFKYGVDLEQDKDLTV